MPGGGHILTGSNDNIARIYDAGSGAEIRQFKGHAQPIAALAVMPDGRHIVTGSDDNTARVWDATNGVERLQLKFPSPVLSVAVTPDGTRIITASDDNSVRVWDAGNGTELRNSRVIPTPSGAWRSTPDGRRIVTGSDDETARVWDVLLERTPIMLQDRCIFAFQASQLHRTAPGSLPASQDNTARLWDAASGAELRQFTGHKRRSQLSLPCWTVDSSLTGSEDSTSGYGTDLPLASSCPSSMDTRSRHEPRVHVRQDPYHHRFDGPTLRVWDTRTGTALLWLRDTTSQSGRGRHIGRLRIVTRDGRLDIVGVGRRQRS